MNKFTFTGTQLGHYQIEEMLDKGGMAMVYRAVDQRDNSVVALKLLYPYLLTEPESVKRFQREATIIQSLNHPYIVALREFGEIDGHFYLAMRFMAGGSLNKSSLATSTFELGSTLKLLRQIASALDYAHSQGVIHRDMKMENILLDENGDSALSDFGIARVVGGTRYTITGQIAGTPQYMSPEQATGKPTDHKCDLYSFAVLAYRLATGTFPFRGDDALAILSQHVTEMPPPASSLNPLLPRELDYVLWQGLAKNPADRFNSADDFVRAFENAFTTPLLTPVKFEIPSSTQEMPTIAATTREASATAQISAAPSARGGRRRILWAAVALLAFFVMIAAVLVYQQGLGQLSSDVPPTEDSSGIGVNSPSASPTTTDTATATQTDTATATFTDTPPSTTTPSRTPRPTSTRMPSTATFTPSDVPPSRTPVPPTPVPASPTTEPPTQQPVVPDIVPTVGEIVPGLLP